MTTVPSPSEAAAASAPGDARGRDVVAGLCVAGLLLPEAVAYAGLAHLPVVHALTALMVGLAVYALFGGSRFAIVSPTSSSATLAAAAALSLVGPAATAAAYASVVFALVAMCGAILLVLGLARQGQLSAFVSRPVLRGFAFALALTIVIKQLPDALGFVPPPGATADPLHLLVAAGAALPHWSLPTILVSAAAAITLALLRRWPQLPASMLVIVAALVAAHVLALKSLGVEEVGTLEWPGLELRLPQLPLADWLRVAELAFGLVVLVFAESWGSVRSLALAHGDTLDANRELKVLGACNLTAALLQGMPVGAGFSASTANAAAGARSKRAGAVALGVIVCALLFAAPLLHALPRAVLAVAVAAALWHALDPRPLAALWRMDRDRVPLAGAIVAVLWFGVLHGMLAAIALSLVSALRRFSLPVVHELGEIGDTRNFVVIDAHADAVRVPGVLVLRPEEPLFFANAERVAAEVLARLAAAAPGTVRAVVLSLEESADLDSTAAECIVELARRLRALGVTFVLSRAKDAVRALLTRIDAQGAGDDGRMFFSVADAVQAVRGGPG